MWCDRIHVGGGDASSLLSIGEMTENRFPNSLRFRERDREREIERERERECVCASRTGRIMSMR